MRAVIQRVSEAKVTINGEIKGEIQKGFVVLLGIAPDDELADIEWLCSKIVNQRIFSDDDGKMNLSIKEVAGEILLISQFTLFASTKKGNRPSFISSAKPEIAIPLYEKFKQVLASKIDSKLQTGEFGADMKVSLVNDGPVTLIIDTKLKE